MSNISTLVVSLVAKTSAFDRKMRQSKSSIYNLQRGMAGTQRSMMNMARGALAVAGVAGLGYMLKSTMSEIDAIAKMSDRLDIATEKLIGLHHAAKIMGTSGEALDKALTKMSKNLGEVAFKTSEVEYALDYMGLSAKEFDQLKTYDKFLKLSDAMNAMPDAQRIALITSTFGKSGTELTNLIMTGSKGIEGLVAEAEKLGLTFSRLDASKVEQANDAIERMQAAFKGAFQTLVIALAPNITAIADRITAMGTDGKNMGDIMVNALSSITGGFISMGGSVASVTAQFYALQQSIYESADALTNLDELFSKDNTFKMKSEEAAQKGAVAYQKYIDGLNKAQVAQIALQDLLKSGGGEQTPPPVDLDLLKELTDTSEKLQKQLDTFGMSSNESMLYDLQKLGEGLDGSNLEMFNSQLETIKGTMVEIEKLNVWEKEQADYEKFVETLKTPLDKAMESYKNIDRAFEDGLITLAEWKKLWEGVNEEFGVSTGKAAESAFAAMPGEFQAVQEKYVSVAGLSMGGFDPIAKKLDEQVHEQKKTTQAVEKLEGVA